MSSQVLAEVRDGAGVSRKSGAVATSNDDALVMLLRMLERRGYRFVTPTPATHARVVSRPGKAEAASITDVLGWSLPFRSGVLDDDMLALLDRGAVLRRDPDGRLQSTIRVSRLHDQLFIHSAYPTEAEDAVFLGPDSYRFADLIDAELTARPLSSAGRIVDIGCGAGVGALVAAALCPGTPVTMTDVNPDALRFARINAEAARTAATFVCSDNLDAIDDPIGLAMANPPFIIDDAGRAYRHGGGMHGTEVALDMAKMALPRLARDGRLILYTGSAIIDGGDPLADSLAELAARSGRSLRYREIDPDVFGEELDRPAYADVDRIAVVAAIIGPIER